MASPLKWRIAQRLEIWWWKQYLRNQSKEEYFGWKTEYWNRFIRDYHPQAHQKNGLNILDAGCGPAGIFSVLDKHRVMAIDPLLHKYREEIGQFQESDYPWTEFVCSDMESFSHSDTFDIIFSVNAINHVHDLEGALLNLNGLLSASGTLVLTTDCHNTKLLKPLFRAIPGDALHPHQHNRADYEIMIKQAGFNILKTERIKKAPIFDYYLFIAAKS